MEYTNTSVCHVAKKRPALIKMTSCTLFQLYYNKKFTNSHIDINGVVHMFNAHNITIVVWIQFSTASTMINEHKITTQEAELEAF